MDDINKAISDILGSEEGRKNLQSVASMLGMELPQNIVPAAPNPNPPPQQQQQQQAGLAGLDPQAIMKISQLMQRMNSDDDNTRLLKALRPHIHNQKKLDEAIRILQLLSLLPALRESGIFGGER